jgi:hypothetical protein
MSTKKQVEELEPRLQKNGGHVREFAAIENLPAQIVSLKARLEASH